MKAQSSTYIKLQSLYRTKARQDVEEIMSVVRSIEGSEHVAQADVELFCKNAKFIKLVCSSEDAPSISTIAGRYMPKMVEQSTRVLYFAYK
jgi:amyloid beta precursor protein binding protein 1